MAAILSGPQCDKTKEEGQPKHEREEEMRWYKAMAPLQNTE